MFLAYSTTRKVTVAILVALFALLIAVSWVSAEPNQQINYQGKLTDGSGVAVPDGSYNMRFWLLQSTSQATTSAVWTESLIGTDQVQVTNGLFSVMLGSTSPLTSVDFNQTLYLGVEIGGTGAPAWDGEMSPRKLLGTVPAAFESLKLGGVASSSFLRSDQADSMAATTASTLLTLQQSGAGDVLSLLDGSANNLFTVTGAGEVGIGTTTMDRLLNVAGATNAGARFTDTTNEVKVDVRSEDFQGFMGTFSNHDLRLITNNTSRLTITSGGNVGIGTTSPYAKLSLEHKVSDAKDVMRVDVFDGLGTTTKFIIDTDGSVGIGGTTSPLATLSVEGTLALTGGLHDNSASLGLSGMVLQTTGAGVEWVATSTLGLGGVSSFLGLSDTPGSYTAGSLLFTSGSAVTQDNTNLFWDDGNNRLGIRTNSPAYALDVQDASTAEARIYSANGGASASLLLAKPGRTWAVSQGVGVGDDQFRIYDATAGQTRLSISSNGYVGIGANGNSILDVASGQARMPDGSIIAGGTPGLAFHTVTNSGFSAGSGNLAIFESGSVGINITSASKDVRLPSDFRLAWSSATTNNAGADTTIYRNAANVIRTGGSFLVDGNVGIGTTSPYAKLSIAGAAHVGGNLTATGTIRFTGLTGGLLTANSVGVLSTTTVASSSLAAGNWANGRLLMASTTATGGFDWVATSTLGIDSSADDLTNNSIEDLQDVAAMTENYGDLFYWNGTAWADIATSSLGLGNGTFLGLSDTPGSFTSNAIPYVSGSALAFDSTFVYDGTNLGLGTASPGAMLDIFGTGNSLRLSYDGSNYAELSVNSSGILSLTSTGGTGSGYTLGSGLAEDTFTLFDGNALDFYFGLDDSDDTFKLGTGSAVGANVIGAFTSATTTFNTAIVASTTATSTFTNGIALSGGCFRTADGNCLQSAGDTSVVVAASNSSAAEKAYADYVADGTSDEVEIQQAIDYVYANGGGGTVYLLAGNFEVSTSTAPGVAINMATNTRLIGQGVATLLKLKDSNDAGSVVIVNAQNTPGITVSNFKIDANQDNQSGSQVAIYLSGASSSTVSNMEIAEVAQYAVSVEASADVRIVNNLLRDSSYGIRAYSSNHAIIQNNNLRQIGNTALYLEDVIYSNIGGNTVVGTSVAGGYAGGGISVIEQSMYNDISQNNLSNLASGIEFDAPISYAPSYNTISHNTIVNIFYDNEGNLEGTGINLRFGSSNNTISDNNIENIGGSGISLSLGSGANSVISGNYIYKAGLSGTVAAVFVDDNSDTSIIANNIYSTSTYAMIEIGGNTYVTYLSSNSFTNPNGTNYVADAGTDTRYNEWDRTTITTDAARGYNLFSIIGSTTATSAAITQLGTGDIFTLDNVSGRVFTVNNSGDVGVGTASPNYKLTIAGDVNTTAATGLAGYRINGLPALTGSTTLNNFYLAGASSTSFTNAATYNYALGGNALTYLTTGDNNFAVGKNALRGSTTVGTSGSNNTALGEDTLLLNTTGSYNNALGFWALNKNTTGSNNNAFGKYALWANTTGGDNNAFGDSALLANTTGTFNNAFGDSALTANTSGSHNNALGQLSLSTNTTGSHNTAIGNSALLFNSSGAGNLALGNSALYLNSAGSYNTALGSSAVRSNSVGWDNIGIGRSALYANTTGSYNTAIGYQALDSNIGTGTIAIGYNAAENATGVDRGIFIGYDIDAFSTTQDDVLNIGNLIFGNGVDGTGTTISSGNIGIGTSSPSARLTIQGAAGAVDTFRIASSTGAATLAMLSNGNLELPGQLISAGIDWTARSAAGGDDQWMSVAYGNGRYVAVGNFGDRVMTSTDGVNWATTTAAGDNDGWQSVTYGNGMFVAVGEYSFGSYGDVVMTSPDGINWTARSAAGNNDDWYEVTYGNGLFVAVGTGSGADRVMTSPDGINWTVRSAAGNNDLWQSVTYGNGLFVAVAGGFSGDHVMTSPDGINWTVRSAAGNNDYWYTITYGNGLFVAGGAVAGDRVMTSPDGINWTVRSAAGDNDGWYGLTYGNGLFVAAGNTGDRIMTSPDGINWTVRSAAGDNDGWQAATFANGQFVAVASNGDRVMTSGKTNASSLAHNNIYQGGTSFFGGLRVGTTTSSVASIFFQGQSGETPFAVASSTGARLLTLTQTGNFGIGTSSPAARLSVAGNTWLDSNVINFASSSASSLLLNYFAAATSTIKQNSAFAWTIATSSSVSPVFRIDTSGSYANTLITGGFDVNNGALSYNASTNQTTIQNLALGNMRFADNAGVVTWTDMGVTAGASAGTVESYTAAIDGNSLLTLYGESDGAGGVTDLAVGIGTTSPWARFSVLGDVTDSTKPLLTVASSTGSTVFHITSAGDVGIGTTSPAAKLAIQNMGVSGNAVAGLDQYVQTANSVLSAVQYGNRFYMHASNTATTTVVGSIFRLKDDTDFGNTVRGLEVQANKGINTKGENTALSGFARTFGVRGYTSADAGASFEPAGGYFETGGTTQGNAMRGYSSSITTATLLSLFQDSSAFAGTGLEMNFGNTTGSFSSTTSKYLDFQNGGVSVFTVSAYGTTTIGDGTTNNMAGLQIGYGGICVDNDGSCTASTSGRITAVETQTGNSDLAEMYFSDTDLEPGEVVVLREGLSIDRATKESEAPVLGVISTKPGLTLGFDDTSLNEGERAYPLALSGRVPVILSSENGPIERGDSLMLSSLPGVAMKATGTGMVIGIALEDFDEARQYSDVYINQFGDDMVDPVFDPILTNADPRINDGCYYSGGRAAGEEPCIPLVATTSLGQIAEANKQAEMESVTEQLNDLRTERSDTKYLADGTPVRVGRVVMFVDRSYRWFDDSQLASLGVFFATSSVETVGDSKNETIFDRLVALANRFVDGVLSVFTLKADRVETSELCVDGVCVTADDLRTILNTQSNAPISSNNSPVGEGAASEDIDEILSEPATEIATGSVATSTEETATTTEIISVPPETATSSSVVESESASDVSTDDAEVLESEEIEEEGEGATVIEEEEGETEPSPADESVVDAVPATTESETESQSIEHNP